MAPKVFISYSWSSQSHRELVVSWAERLSADGVDVVLDVYDLKEGNDKYAFMERMVSDPSVSHVLVISDQPYALKADARKAGVGTESQIISKEIYESTDQVKFIPIVCQFAEDGQPCLPTFLKSRIWVDFSSPESVNANWEKLIRLLYGKPLYEKPLIGTPPAYLLENNVNSDAPGRAKFESLKLAIEQNRKVAPFRRQYLETTISFIDSLRVRTQPDMAKLAEKIVQDCSHLVLARDLIIDWILLESESLPSGEFIEEVVSFLEKLHELKSRPEEVTSWNESWFDAHKLFVYELFLYIVAALLKTRSYRFLNQIFKSHYMLPRAAGGGESRFVRFDSFYAYSQILNKVLSPPNQTLYSPAAELIKRQAQRKDLPFGDIIQADLLILLMALIDNDVRWYPQLMHYAGFAKEFPFFVRAAQHKNFVHLVAITGIDDAEGLRSAVNAGQLRLNVASWHNFIFDRNFLGAMNLANLDSIS